MHASEFAACDNSSDEDAGGNGGGDMSECSA